MTIIADRIRAELADCEACARREGWKGEWDPTETDLDSIVAALGGKPTREEWEEAGCPLSGSAHVDDDRDRTERRRALSALMRAMFAHLRAERRS
jgi:hypothetical protein